MRLRPKSFVSLLLQCILWERPKGVLNDNLVDKQHLLELELSLRGKLYLVVLEVGELDCNSVSPSVDVQTDGLTRLQISQFKKKRIVE